MNCSFLGLLAWKGGTRGAKSFILRQIEAQQVPVSSRINSLGHISFGWKIHCGVKTSLSDVREQGMMMTVEFPQTKDIKIHSPLAYRIQSKACAKLRHKYKRVSYGNFLID